MTDDELRAMIRESIARHVGVGGGPRPPDPRLHAHLDRFHPSYAMLPLARGDDGEGACLIEPGVRCSHCGYCLSYGH